MENGVVVVVASCHRTGRNDVDPVRATSALCHRRLAGASPAICDHNIVHCIVSMRQPADVESRVVVVAGSHRTGRHDVGPVRATSALCHRRLGAHQVHRQTATS